MQLGDGDRQSDAGEHAVHHGGRDRERGAGQAAGAQQELEQAGGEVMAQVACQPYWEIR